MSMARQVCNGLTRPKRIDKEIHRKECSLGKKKNKKKEEEEEEEEEEKEKQTSNSQGVRGTNVSSARESIIILELRAWAVSEMPLTVGSTKSRGRIRRAPMRSWKWGRRRPQEKNFAV
jgi:hypothetical protein